MVRLVEPLTDPAFAVIVTVPGRPVPAAQPALPESLAMVAVLGFETLQATDDSFCVLLSLNVPVATNCWLPQADIEGFAGLMVIETNPGGVSVAGW